MDKNNKTKQFSDFWQSHLDQIESQDDTKTVDSLRSLMDQLKCTQEIDR